MPRDVPFIFGLGPDEPCLSEQSNLWSAPLPMSRHAISGSSAESAATGDITYGDYFQAAQDFLSRGEFELLIRSAGLMTDRNLAADDIRQVAVYLLKHGAFYHPARVVLDVLDRELAFVLNVAVSPEGREILPREFDSLSRLNAAFSTDFWPQVYGRGLGNVRDGLDLPMFLGQWLSGFHEFHLTRQGADEVSGVVVWDTDLGHRPLSGSAVPDVIRRAAAILTCAYNPLTFEAILDWHHAAGDFVVRTSGAGIDLRLITVRNYAPMVRHLDPDIEAVLDGLLLFLVHISLRLRLDRIDGVGAPAAYPDDVVPAIYEGFRQGLAMSMDAHGLPDDLIPAVEAYFALHGARQLAPLAGGLLANLPLASDEDRLLRGLVDEHLGLLAGTFVPPDQT